MTAALIPGARVRARGLAWELVEAEPAGDQQRLRLRCQQGALRGEEVDLLHPFESVELIATELDPRRAGQLRPWILYHQAFLLEQALGPRALLATQPGRLDVAPYQLVPVMRALAMPRPRLLLADGVGLGKTIEAGLILAEWIARRRGHRILVVSPAGPLLDQWHREMRVRFGLRFQPLRDWGSLQEVRRGLELGANPFDALPLCLVSIDFAKQEKVLQDLERTEWDVVVVDEAHHCVHTGADAEREASLRRRLAEVLARQADALLLLTATPHDGYDPHFASLVELLDPSLVDGRGGLRGDRYRHHVVRRLKQHVHDPTTGAPRRSLQSRGSGHSSRKRLRAAAIGVPNPQSVDRSKLRLDGCGQRGAHGNSLLPSCRRAQERGDRPPWAFFPLLGAEWTTLARRPGSVIAAATATEAESQALQVLRPLAPALTRTPPGNSSISLRLAGPAAAAQPR